MRELSIRITADDSTARAPLARTEQGLQKVEGAGNAANRAIGITTGSVKTLGQTAEGMGSKFSGVTSVVQRGASLMTGAIAGFAGGLGIGLVTTGVAKLGEVAAKFIGTAGDIADTASRLGVSTEAIQRWSFAVDQTGGSMSALASSAQILFRHLSEGDDSVRAAVGELGLSFDAIKAMSPEKAFETIADAIGRMQNPMDQARIGADLMGRGFAANLGTMKEGFSTLGHEAEAAGAIMSDSAVKAGDELGDAWAKLMDVGGALLSSVLMPILPVLTDLLSIVGLILKPFADLLELVLRPIGFVLGIVSEGLKTVVGWITDLFKPVGDASGALKEFWSWLAEKLQPVLGPIGELIGSIAQAFVAFGEFVFAVHVKVISAVAEMAAQVIYWVVDKLRPIWEPLIPIVQKFVTVFTAAKDTVIAVAKALYEGVKTWLVDRFTDIVQGIKGKIDAVTGFFRDMYEKVVGGSIVPDMIVGIGVQIARLDEVMMRPVEEICGRVTGRFRQMSNDITGLLSSWGDSLGSLIEGHIGGIIGRGFAGLASGIVSAFGGILTGGLTQLIGLATGLVVSGVKKLGGLIWDGLKGIGNFIGGLFGGNATAGSREDFAKSLGFGNLGALYDQLRSMGEGGEALANVGLNVIGRNDKAANAQWMQDVMAFLNGAPRAFTQATGGIGGAETEPFDVPSFENRPLERVTKAGLVMTHPGDVVGVPNRHGVSVNVTVDAQGSIFRDSRRSAREFAEAIADQLTLVLNNANT